MRSCNIVLWSVPATSIKWLCEVVWEVEDHVNPTPPLFLAGPDDGAWQMAKLLIAGTGYDDTLTTFDTRIRWLKEQKICHQLLEEWCSKEPNKATGLMRAQRCLLATGFYSQHSSSHSSHTGQNLQTHSSHPPQTKIHTQLQNTHNYSGFSLVWWSILPILPILYSQ